MSKLTLTFAANDELGAQITKQNQKLEELNNKIKEVDKSGQKVEQTLNKAFDFAKIAAGATAAFAVIKTGIDTGYVALTKYGDYQERLLKTQAQLKVSASDVGLSFSQIKNLATQSQLSTGKNNEEVMKGINILQSYNNVRGDIFTEAVKQSANIGAVWGDLGQAAKNLGAILNDPINELGKLNEIGIRFNTTQADHLKYLVQIGQGEQARAEILATVRSRYEDIATTVNSGVNGSFRNLSTVADTTMQNIGQAVATWAEPAIKALTDRLNVLNAQVTAGSTTTYQKGLVSSLGASYQSYYGRGSTADTRSKIASQVSSVYGSLEASGYSLYDQINALEVQKADIQRIADNYAKRIQETKNMGLDSGLLEQDKKTWDDQISQYNIEITKLNNIKTLVNQVAEAKAKANPPASPIGTGLAPTFTPAWITGYTNPGKGMLVDSGYTAPTTSESFTPDWIKGYTNPGYGMSVDSGYSVPGGGSLPSLGEYFQNAISPATELFNTYKTGLDSVGTLFATLDSQRAKADQARIDNLKTEFDLWKTHEDAKIAQAKENGTYTVQMSVDLENERYAKAKDIANAEKKIKHDDFERNKLSQIAQATMSTYTGATASLPNLVLAGLVTGLGLANVGAIMSQANPYWTGGIIQGNSKIGDRVPIMANADEMMITKSQQGQLWNTINGGGGKSSGGGTTNIYVVENAYGDVSPEFVRRVWKTEAKMQKSYQGVI